MKRSRTRLWISALGAALLCLSQGASALPAPEEVILEVPIYGSSDSSDVDVYLSQDLDAYLYRPEGAGPHPAVVDLHGCNGIWPVRSRGWIALYLEMGLAVLQIDSFRPRGRENICGSLFAIPTWQRALDAHVGKDWLQQQDWVDPQRIFLTGFSHGATTTLLALSDDLNTQAPFAGAVATAPWCLDTLDNSHTDLLVLIGGADRWTPAQRCKLMSLRDRSRFELVVYEGVHHSFDAPGTDSTYLGNRVLYDATATRDAHRRVREFFGRFLLR